MARKNHAPRNAAMIALFVIACGAIANRYATESDSFILRDRNRVIATPVNSSLPSRFPNGETLVISRERNAGILKNVLEVFAPSLRPFLTSVPIVLDASANTAKAYPRKGYIGVSPDWDKTVLQSRYREIYERRGMRPDDPVFTNRFKTNLLIHEFLHLLQIHLAIDGRLFYAAVARWYSDSRYGRPSPNGMVGADATDGKKPEALAINRMKYVLWHALYNYRKLRDLPQDESWQHMQYGERYRAAAKGVEEFAYIGEEILSAGSSSDNYIQTGQWCDKDWQSKKMRLREVSPELIALFSGVFNPDVMR